MQKSIFTKKQDQLRAALVHERKKAGLTQKDVARRLGVYDSYVSKYELGERRIDVVELMSLAKAIGFRASDLILSVEDD